MASAQHSDAATMPTSATDTSSPSSESTPGLPPMRFADGNVVIHISADPRESLLVHEDFLCAVDPLFDAELRRPWTKSKHVVDPKTGESRKVIEVAMVAQDGTFFLVEGAKYSGGKHEYGTDPENVLLCLNREWTKFYCSASCGPPDDGWAKTAGRNFKILIALIYDIPILLADIIADTEDLEEPPYRSSLVAVRLMDVLVLAEMRGCFNKVAFQVTRMLKKHARTSELVHQDPYVYALLGKILENEDLFCDSLRHILTQKTSRDREQLQELLDIEEHEAAGLLKRHYEMREYAKSRLKRRLRELGLAEVPNVYYGDYKDSYFTTFLNAISHRRRRQAQKSQRTEFVALSIWSQFAIQHLERGNCYLAHGKYGRSKPRDTRSFSNELQAILDAAKSDNPCALFGYKIAEGHAKVFGKETIDQALLTTLPTGLVQKAAEMIESWGQIYGAQSGIIKDGVLSWADVHNLMQVTPWKKAEQAEQQKRLRSGYDRPMSPVSPAASTHAPGSVADRHASLYPETPSVNLAPADEAWLRVLGLLNAPEEEANESEEDRGDESY